MFSLTLFTIATGKYWQYFLRLLPEIQANLNRSKKIQIIVLTDPKNCNYKFYDKRIILETLPIKNEPWPDITLFRYSKILQHEKYIKGKNLMWLDVDTSIKNPVDTDFYIRTKSMYFSLHPGFQFTNWNIPELSKSNIGLSLKMYAKGLVKSKFGTFGWEFDRKSTAFVPLHKRFKYVYGACWMGESKTVLNMCLTLAERIEADRHKGIIAIWHDESHLNWFSRNNQSKFLPRNFVANPEWIWNSSKKAKILALNKSKLDENLNI